MQEGAGMIELTIKTETGQRSCVHDNQGRACWPDDMSGAELVRALRIIYEAGTELERRIASAIGEGKREGAVNSHG
jgi:hypothetical protein